MARAGRLDTSLEATLKSSRHFGALTRAKAGAFHDVVILLASTRHNGKSISLVAELRICMQRGIPPRRL